MPITDTKFNPSGDPRIHNIKEAALAFERVIRHNSDIGHRQSVALTHLETASMWAVKAAAVGDK
ncbi:MAG: DUF7681 family protein [Paracoccaceae bacterium]